MDLRRLAAAIGLVMGLSLLITPTAWAGDGPDPLDELREQVPEGEPGEFDLTEADIRFKALVEAYGRVAETSDFGDGSELTGPCGGWAWSYDSDGDLLDAALDVGDDAPPVDILDGGQAFTAGNPFKVDTNGVVVYYGFMPEVGDGPLNHDWEIVTSGISIDQGGDPNPDAKNRNSGLVDLADQLPVKFNASARIEGSLFSDNLLPCVGKGHIDFIASGITPALLGSIAALGGGFFGLLFNARPAMTSKA